MSQAHTRCQRSARSPPPREGYHHHRNRPQIFAGEGGPCCGGSLTTNGAPSNSFPQQPLKEPADYLIQGADSQVVTIAVGGNKELRAEPGTMMFMSPNMSMTTEGCCTPDGCKRSCGGEPCIRAVFTNESADPAYIGLTPNFPAKVVPVDLGEIGGKVVTKGGAYMAHVGDAEVSFDLDCCSFTCCCGGLGFIRQSIEGDGTVFLNAGGTVVSKTLEAGETIVIDESSIVGYSDTAEMGIRKSGGLGTCCFGGEGLFVSTITGPGIVIMQSMSFEKYKAAVAPVPQSGGNSGPESQTME